MKTFSIGGVHPDDKKISAGCRIEALPIPKTVYISMAQHLGGPAKAIVAPGDKVKTGQVIGEPTGFISAYVHSSVTGTVKSVGLRKDLAGIPVVHVEIETGPDEWADGIDTSDTLVTDIPQDRQFIIDRIKNNGVVRLGGSTFPTHVKLCPHPSKIPEFPILHRAEVNPKLNSAYRTMPDKDTHTLLRPPRVQ